MDTYKQAIVKYFLSRAKIPRPENWSKEREELLEIRVFNALIDTVLHFGTKYLSMTLREYISVDDWEDGGR